MINQKRDSQVFLGSLDKVKCNFPIFKKYLIG